MAWRLHQTSPGRRALAGGLLLAACLLGCTEEPPGTAGVVKPRTSATATPQPTGSGLTGGITDTMTPPPTPTPLPSPTPTLPPITSGVDTSASAAPIQTVPTPPGDPTPTPPGAEVQHFLVPNGPRALAFLANSQTPWIARSGDLVRLDDAGSVAETYALGGQTHLASVGLTDLWVASSGTARVRRLFHDGPFGLSNPVTVVVPSGLNGLAADATEAWSTHSGGTVLRIDRATGATASFTVSAPTAIALDATYAWVTALPDQLHRIRRSDGAITAYPVGAAPVAVAVDHHGTVWTANRDASSLSRLASGAGSATTVDLSAAPSALAADDNRLWVAHATLRQVTRLALDGTVEGTSDLEVSPAAMALDPTGRLWLADPNAHTVTTLWGR